MVIVAYGYALGGAIGVPAFLTDDVLLSLDAEPDITLDPDVDITLDPDDVTITFAEDMDIEVE